jgi:1-acyl-sn-glycerol-3-phosphate acyltransferase
MSRRHPQLEMEPVYGLFHALGAILQQTVFRGEAWGLEHLPARGGYIVASNHASLLDPFAVGLHVPRQVSFFARKTLWHPGFATWWLDAVRAIPVDRDGGVSLDAIKRVLQALREERVVIVFPEGTRTPDGRLQPPKPGVGLIACRAQVPVVPARIFGSYEAFGRDGVLRLGTPVSAVYGPPLAPADYDRPGDGKERYARTAERIMAAIARLEPPPRPVI